MILLVSPHTPPQVGAKISFLPPDLYTVQRHTCLGALFEGYTILQGMKLSVQFGGKGSVLYSFGPSIYGAKKGTRRRTALRVPPLKPGIGAEGSVGEVELSFCESVGGNWANSIWYMPACREQSLRPWRSRTCGSRHTADQCQFQV